MEDYNEIEQQVIDIVLSIPIDKWCGDNRTDLIKTVLKGKTIELIETKRPNGSSYATINIDGIFFRDRTGTEYGIRCKNYYNRIREYLRTVEQHEIGNKIKTIYNQLK